MSIPVDTNVLPLPVNVAPPSVRSTLNSRQSSSGKDSQPAFAGVLKDTSAAQTDSGDTEQTTLSLSPQNPGPILLAGQSSVTKAGKDSQSLVAETGDEPVATDVSVNLELLMAALLSTPAASTTRTAQAATPLTATAGSINAGVALLPVQVATAVSTSATVPSATTTGLTAATGLPMPSGNGIVSQNAPATGLNALTAMVFPGQAVQQPVNTAAGDGVEASTSAGQPAASLLGGAPVQELNIWQVSVTDKTGGSTALKQKAAAALTASANRDVDGTVLADTPLAVAANSAKADTQTSLNLAAFAEPGQAKLKTASGDEAVGDAFAAVVGQQTEKSTLAASVDQAPAQHLPDPHNVLGQVVEQSNFAKPSYDAGNTEMVIKLKPESLGELTLKVAVDNGVVSASFHSDNPEVRGVLQSSLQQLRQELTDRGLQVDNVGVYAGLTDFSSSGQQEAFRQQQQQSATLQHTNSSDNFIAAVESTPVLHNTAVDNGVDYRV